MYTHIQYDIDIRIFILIFDTKMSHGAWEHELDDQVILVAIGPMSRELKPRASSEPLHGLE